MIELCLQQPHRTQCGEALEDVLDGRGLGRVDYQAPLADVIAERGTAAQPHALFLGGGNLVADPFAGDLALELGEGEKHVEGQSPHARRRVERWVTETNDT